VGISGNRYLQGEPSLPYASVQTYPNSDIFMDLAFVDHTQTPVTPTSISIEIDDITNGVVMNGPTALSAAGSTTGPYIYPAFASTMYLQLAASLWQPTYPYTGTQKCQVGVLFTAVDSVTGQPFTSTAALAIIEMVGFATVSGQNP
jgi:hypothetical protein